MQNSDPGTFKHVFPSLEHQIKGQGCLLHQNSCVFDPCHGEEPDFLISGSPCDPFSRQSNKRWQPGAVSGHKFFGVTMGSVVSLYQQVQPPVGLFEQVKGFTMPFDQTTSETPYSRPGLLAASAISCVPQVLLKILAED